MKIWIRKKVVSGAIHAYATRSSVTEAEAEDMARKAGEVIMSHCDTEVIFTTFFPKHLARLKVLENLVFRTVLIKTVFEIILSLILQAGHSLPHSAVVEVTTPP